MEDIVLRTCTKCDEIKPLELFGSDPTCKLGRRYQCKLCRTNSVRTHRQQHPDKYRDANFRSNEKKRLGIPGKSADNNNNYDLKRQYINCIKAERGCLYCSESDEVCLSFHHRNPTEKLFGVANFQGRTFLELDTEIAKCDVVCENCHRKLHAGRFEKTNCV